MKSLVLVMLLFAFHVKADTVKMLTLKTDGDLTQVGEMFLETLADTTFDNVVYGIVGDPAGNKSITVAKLNKSKVAIYKKGPIAVLELAAKSSTKNDMVLSVHYLYKYSIFGSDRRVKNLRMYYVSPANLYETLDPDTQKVVTNAFAYVRYDSSGDAAGIDRIETW